jgi:hypothetical protein
LFEHDLSPYPSRIKSGAGFFRIMLSRSGSEKFRFTGADAVLAIDKSYWKSRFWPCRRSFSSKQKGPAAVRVVHVPNGAIHRNCRATPCMGEGATDQFQV